QHWQAAIAFAVHIPEINACALQFASIGTLDAQVSIAPLGRILFANIVPSDESNLAVYYQYFAMVAHIPAQRERLPEPGEQRIAQDIQIGGKAFELARHHQIREAIVHHIDRHPAISSVPQLHFKLLPDDIIFPDKGLEENALASLANRLLHRLVEVLAIGIDPHQGGTNFDWLGGRARKAPLGAIAFAPEVDSDQDGYHSDLQ